MAIPELGSKQICPSCQAKFYDLCKRPAVCPKCQNAFDPDEAVRSRRTRVRATPADRDELREDQVDKDAAGDEEEEEVSAPALDEVIDDPILAGDDDDDDDAEPGAGPVAPDDELAGFSEGEEALEEEDADVPFLEDDDDDEFDESEIGGLPGEDE